VSSFKATAWAFGLRAEPSEKLVLLALAQFVDESGRCYPARATVASMTGLAERTVQRILVGMTEKGLITRTERFRPNGSRSTDLIALQTSGTLDLGVGRHGVSPGGGAVSPLGGSQCLPQNLSSKNTGEDTDVSSPSGASAPRPWERDEGFTAMWSAVTPQMRTRAKSREKAYRPYREALRAVGGDASALLAALLQYLAHDPDVKRTGGPGFDLWLRDGRWDHWLGVDTATGDERPKWPGPADVFAQVVGLKGAEWAQAWIDPCGWEPSGRVILARTGFAKERIEADLRGLLANKNIRVGVAKPQQAT
jgi:hypothetical protein